MNKLLTHFTENPKTLFLIDSAGALLTSFFLFVIMRQFNEYVGMPETVLTYLSVTAICFFSYSLACFLLVKQGWTVFLWVICIANLLYCILTVGLLVKYQALLTVLGTIYFLMEILIICGLCYIEFTVTNEIRKRDGLIGK